MKKLTTILTLKQNLEKMNKIETLPKFIVVKNDKKDEKLYELRMHITAWGKICLCYSNMFSHEMNILSQVVEPCMTTNVEFSECINDIVDTPDFDSAVDMLKKRVTHALGNESIAIYNPMIHP